MAQGSRRNERILQRAWVWVVKGFRHDDEQQKKTTFLLLEWRYFASLYKLGGSSFGFFIGI